MTQIKKTVQVKEEPSHKVQGMHLSWIVVNDIEKAIRFYTETVGLVLKEFHKEFGWAELSGPEGAILGIAQYSDCCDIKAGNNAVATITVDDLDATLKVWAKKGVRLVGEVLEVPGHVKMQTFTDTDGNTLQVVQVLSK